MISNLTLFDSDESRYSMASSQAKKTLTFESAPVTPIAGGGATGSEDLPTEEKKTKKVPKKVAWSQFWYMCFLQLPPATMLH